MKQKNINRKIKITCIIPAYNEGKRIKNVLNAVKGHPLIDETIVINDGSKDDTSSQAKRFKSVKVIDLKKNVGKTAAVVHGIKAAKNDMIVMLDSDLIGIKKEHITRLIMPVLEDKADTSISLQGNSLFIYRLIGLDFVSGQRLFEKKIMTDYKRLEKLPGFGLESYMNSIIIEKKMRIAIINWADVNNTRKSEKMGFFAGIKAELRMIVQIIKTISIFTVVYQIWKMKSLAIKSKKNG